MPEGSALCFYDYDPTTETMMPEKDNAVLRFKPSKDHFAQYEFPNLGRDMLVGDTDKSYDATWHVFAWDGMNFKEETSYTDDDLRKAVVGLWMNVDKKFPFTFRISADDEGWPVITDCGIYDSTEYDAHLSCYEGRVVVAEQSPKGDDEEEDEDERFEPSLVCHFRLTKDGRLTGGYYMKQPGGKEYNGIMTLEKQSALNDYAE